jgi:hypothetical protein
MLMRALAVNVQGYQEQTACDADTKGSCAWNATAKECFEFEVQAKIFTEIKPVAEAGTYVDKDVSTMVIADDNSHVYVVNAAAEQIRIFRNDAVANLETGANWSSATARGAGAGAGGGINDIDLTQVAAAVTQAGPAPTGAVFKIAPGATANSQGIAVFYGCGEI